MQKRNLQRHFEVGREAQHHCLRREHEKFSEGNIWLRDNNWQLCPESAISETDLQQRYHADTKLFGIDKQASEPDVQRAVRWIHYRVRAFNYSVHKRVNCTDIADAGSYLVQNRKILVRSDTQHDQHICCFAHRPHYGYLGDKKIVFQLWRDQAVEMKRSEKAPEQKDPAI